MNYLSYDVMSLLSSLTTTSIISNDHNEAIPTKEVGTAVKQQTPLQVIHGEKNTGSVNEDANKHAIHTNELVPSVFRKIPMKNTVSDIEFQIRSTVHSWSFCWNRGDIIGYCDSYYDDHDDNSTRYTSVSRHGTMTTILGHANIITFFTTIFQQCETYQSKVLRELSESSFDTVATTNRGVAGFLEYSNLQIQFIPFITSSNITDEALIATNHAVVFGHYTLEYSTNNANNERGIFTLHLIQRPCTTPTSTTVTSSKWYIQSEHSSALQ